ncbi:MAG: acyltransferase family protein [Betaproteobacteria bacterium]|jgi:exopolysaccharide production protein ExoZ
MRAAEPFHPGAEALRGLAALMVVATHYVTLVQPLGPGLWGLAATGVDLFFVISGFVFAKLLAQPGWSLAGYGVRRLFRLYPLYLVALLTYALLQPAEGRWQALPAHLAMLHTTGSLQTAAAYNVAFWSLPPEVEFYLLLPALAWLAWHGARTKGRALWILLAAALALKLGLVMAAEPSESPEALRSVLTVHAPGLLIEFLLGSAVAVLGGHVRAPHLARPWSHPWRMAAAALGLVGLVALVVVYAQHLASTEQAAHAPLWLKGHVGLWAAACYAAMMLVLKPAQQACVAEAAPSGHAQHPWRWSWHAALWAGRWSYGIYLFHNATPALLTRLWPTVHGWPLLLLSLVLTLVVAAALHSLVEWPARQWGRRLAQRLERRSPSGSSPA